MKKIDVVRAWKDERYRLSLSEEELAQLPPNPIGVMNLPDDDLRSVFGGLEDPGCTCNCCTCTCCTCCCCCGDTDIS